MSASPSRKKLVRSLAALPALCLGLALLSGCGDQGYPEDLTYSRRSDPMYDSAPQIPPTKLDTPGQWHDLYAVFTENGGKLLDPDKAQKRSDVDTVLKKAFGTPAHPTVKAILDESEEALQPRIDKLQLDDATLAAGSKLYRKQCLHCHGLTGDGRGPTGQWVNPHPRDYRSGIFKFISTNSEQGNARKPRREDLLRTLREGIDGTSMPSFGQLSDDDLRKLASYVIHLSIRGQVELETLKQLATQPDELEGDSVEAHMDYVLMKRVTNLWASADENAIQPQGYQDLIGQRQRKNGLGPPGQQLFKTAQAQCISCHRDYGRAYDYKWDEWGTVTRPADLTQGIYRGGRRPIDLYYRVHSGINGVGMPGFGFGAAPVLKPAQVWDIVNFMQALPYPMMLPKDIRDEIYPDYRR